MTTSKVFEELAYTGLDWPGKTTRLRSTSLEDYLQRPSTGAVSIAELYHENSKLHPSKAATLLASQIDAERFRRETLERSAQGSGVSSQAPASQTPEKVRTLLNGLAAAVDINLFYAVELRLLIRDWLLAWEPLHQKYTPLKRVPNEDLSVMEAALSVMGRQQKINTGPILFLLGWFARNDLLFGARGYRRTLLETGRVLEALIRECHKLGIEAHALTEFTDIDIDRTIEADGVEQGTVAVVVLGNSCYE